MAGAFVGVDLAWGECARTGIAIVNTLGELVQVALVRSDDEIEAVVAPYLLGGGIVAVDAPIVVNNDSGQRPCERLVGRYFGKYAASAYPANRGNPAFADGSRAARIAARLRLDIDPATTAGNRMIEVYPHPAIVMLFGLERTLPYKAKKGRDVVSRRAVFLELMTHLESLENASQPLRLDGGPWGGLRRQVEDATRQVDLERAEDQLDAVVCAYIGLLHARAPGSVRTLGDVDNGYIVTPATPQVAARIDRDTPHEPREGVHGGHQ